MLTKIITIGVYGYDDTAFFRALREAGVDTFCDIRQRRGVRGATYAFVNSKRLQARLAEMDIHYLHRKDLAPTTAVRNLQEAHDKNHKIAKRQRTRLSSEFIAAYQTEILSAFDPQSLLEELKPEAQVMALFCVEREPEACHRSLVAKKLGRELGVVVTHVRPA